MSKKKTTRTEIDHDVLVAAKSIEQALIDSGIDAKRASEEALELVTRMLDEKNHVKSADELAYDWLEANVKNSADPRMCVIGIIEHTPEIYNGAKYELPFSWFSFSKFGSALRRAKFGNVATALFQDMLYMFQYAASLYVDTKPNARVRSNSLDDESLGISLLNTDEYAPDVEIPQHMRRVFNSMMGAHLRSNFTNTLLMYAPEYIADNKKRKKIESVYKIKFEAPDIDNAREALENPNHTHNAMQEAARKLRESGSISK